jgi:hypothetical protein
MSFSPVVSGTGLSEDKIVWSEDLSVWAGPNRIHGSRFEINENSSWNILPTRGFVVVDINTFQLEVGVSMISSRGVDSVLVGNDLPELK